MTQTTERPPTRLSRLCEATIEACWLAAIVVTPLFMNVYSHRVFEPDKTAMLRSLVLVMGSAWLIRAFELRQTRASRRRAPIPAMVPVVILFLLVGVLATAFSVSPYLSVWGSYPRLQGLYTTAAYVAVFLSIVGLLRTRAQIERLITTALLASLPVSLYGIIQYFGADPLPWAGDVTERVTSTMGNPVFVAAFLVMTVPLTFYRLVDSGGLAGKKASDLTRAVLLIGGLVSLIFQMAAFVSGPPAGTASAAITVATWATVAIVLKRPLVPFLRISVYTVLLSAQLMCIVFSQSRGPWLALAGGLFLFILLWTLVRGRRRQFWTALGTALAIVSVVGALNWPGSPLGSVRGVPYVGRLAALTNVEGGSGRVRVLIWEGTTELVANDPTRSAIGYGPETMNLVFPPYYRAELGRRYAPDAMPDRAHNEIFQVLVTTGFLGLAVYLVIVTGLFYYGLRWIGLLENTRDTRLFLLVWSLSGTAAVAIAVLVDGAWRFSGIALPIGLFVGLVAYLSACALSTRRRERDVQDARTAANEVIIVAIVSMIGVHFLETQLGFAIVATRTYFWVFAGVMVAAARRPHRPPEPGVAPTDRDYAETRLDSGSRRRTTTPIATTVLLTLIYNFLLPNADLSRFGYVAWLLAFTWAFGGFVVIAEALAQAGASGPRPWRALMKYATFTLAAVVVYSFIQAGLPLIGVADENLIFGYAGVVLITVLGLALVLTGADAGLMAVRSIRLYPVYLLLAVCVAFTAQATNIDDIRADVHLRKASRNLRLEQYPEAVAELRKAVRTKPRQDMFHLFLGKALLEQARAGGDPDSLLPLAERALLRAEDLSPLDPTHAANLGRLYQGWAIQTARGPLRNARFRSALSRFEEATTASPHMPHLWNERGKGYRAAGDAAAAERMFRHSLELDDRFHPTHLLIGDLHLAQKRWADAADSYEEALRLQPHLTAIRIRLAAVRARLELERTP